MDSTLEWVFCSLQKYFWILKEATIWYLHRQQLLCWLHHTYSITIAANISVFMGLKSTSHKSAFAQLASQIVSSSFICNNSHCMYHHDYNFFSLHLLLGFFPSPFFFSPATWLPETIAILALLLFHSWFCMPFPILFWQIVRSPASWAS